MVCATANRALPSLCQQSEYVEASLRPHINLSVGYDGQRKFYGIAGCTRPAGRAGV